MMQNTKSSSKLVKNIILALLGTVSLLLFFLNFPLPFLPPYLKVDFSDLPAILASFIFTPLAGVVVVAIKNALYFIVSGSGDPVGVIANFCAGVMFTFPLAYLYHKRKKGVKTIVSGLIAGTVVMTIGMSILNYIIILPAYALVMGWDMNAAAKLTTIGVGIIPFNVLKGVIIGLLFVPLYKRMRHWIEDKKASLA